MAEADAPSVSVIVPVHNGGDVLRRCLEAIGRSAWPVLECIVVDDASTDGRTAETAERCGARVVRQARQRGPAAARNAGAAEARGDILFFTDADVVLQEQAIARAAQTLSDEPGIAAVFGSYDERPGDPGLLSRYRNLYHHWNHQVGQEEASTFWSGCGAIRREVFTAAGGFSEAFARPSIEDIELGYRLRAAGHRIRLLKDMQCTHLKRWTLGNMVRTDIFSRGVPWVRLLRRFPDVPADLNLGWRARLATVCTGLLGLSVLVLLWLRPAALLPGAALLLACLASAWLARGSRGRVAGLRAGPEALVCDLPGDMPGDMPSDMSGDMSGDMPWDLPANWPAGWLAGALAVLLPLLAAWQAPEPWALLPLVLAAAVAWVQLDFYRLVARLHGLAFALAVWPLQLLFFLGCGIAVPLGLVMHRKQAATTR